MADEKFSQFSGGTAHAIQNGDIVVGLRGGVNYQFFASAFGSQVVVVSTATQAMTTNTIYIADDASSLVTFTLPAASAIGDRLSVIGQSADGWIITEGTGQQIIIGSSETTATTGSVASTNRYDTLNLICLTANLLWTTFGAPQGNLTIF